VAVDDGQRNQARVEHFYQIFILQRFGRRFDGDRGSDCWAKRALSATRLS
jgi:hypothetical protein